MKKYFLTILVFPFFLFCQETKKSASPFDHDNYRYVYNAEKHYFEYYGPDKKKIANIVHFDNGPDDYSDGLRRIIEKKKYGFINKQNLIVIPAQFQYASPFKDGFATVAKNVHFEKAGEHEVVTNGQWGLINKKGKVVVPIIYDSIKDYSDNSATVVFKGQLKSIKFVTTQQLYD